MANLIIIDGTSGVWKNDLVNYVTNKLIDSTLIIKTTTRVRRESDLKLDLSLVSHEEFNKERYEYRYKYNGEYYGFSKSVLDNALAKYKNVFLIVRNIDVINHLCEDFRKVNIIKIFVYTDIQKVSERMSIEKNHNMEQAIKEALEDYLRNPEIYDLVLINGSTENDFYRLIDYSINFANEKKQKRKVFMFERRNRILINIILGFVDTLVGGIAINSITSSPLTQWNIICFGLSIFCIILLVIIHLFVNKSE